MATREEYAAKKQAATEAYAKSTDRAVKLVIKGLAIGMSIDAALEVVNERLSGVLNQKYGIDRRDTSGACLSPVPFVFISEILEQITYFSLLLSVECEINNDVVTRIWLSSALTDALFNTADMQADDFLLQIRQNYEVGVEEGDWTVFQFDDSWSKTWPTKQGWEYSSPEGYRIRVFDNKAIEMKKIPKSSERRFN